MLGEKFTLDIRPTFVDELDWAAAYIELHQFRVLTIVGYTLVLLILIGMPIATVG